MTKSRTLRKAGAVVLSLAMAFSVAGVAPSADAAAKKPALSAKKGTITVGKTKAVKIKNTTAKKVKKLVVSSNKTAVATVKKSSKVKFIVTGKKAGTAKITAKVTLKKAVAKKKKYTLKYTATVKKATTPTTAPEATATPGELKLDSVEGAQRDNATKQTNVIVAYFSAAVADFAATDVEIRRVSDNRLYTVEKVVTSSDKKKATLTLTGSNSAGAIGAEFLSDNVEYKLIVNAGGKAYEKVFTIPATLGDVTVTSVNKTKKTISVGTSLTGATGVVTEQELGVPATLTVDYEDILGRTVTVSYDKTNTLTSLKEADEKVVFGGFKADSAKAGKGTCLEDQITKEKYYVKDTAGADWATLGTDRGAAAVAKMASGTDATKSLAYDIATVCGTNAVVYGKLVLDGANKVKSFSYVSAWDGTVIADKVEGTSVFSGKTETALQGYTIVKDGKTIEASAIAAGDVVSYNITAKFAEVYGNKITGKITATYDDKSFDIGTDHYAGKDAKYVKDGAGLTDVDKDYLDALKKKGEDVSIYTDRTKTPRIIAGATEATVTNTKTLILSKNAEVYTQSLANYIRLTGFDATGTTTTKYDIDISSLTSIVKGSTVADKYEVGTDAGATTKTNPVASFVPCTNSGTAQTDFSTAANYFLAVKNKDNTAAKIVDLGGTSGSGNELTAGELVTLTLNDKNVVTGITMINSAGAWEGTTGEFKNSLATLRGKEVPKTTPVYKVTVPAATANYAGVTGGTNVPSGLTITTWGEFAGSMTAGNAHTNGFAQIYQNDGKTCTAVLVFDNGSNIQGVSDGSTTSTVLVTEALQSGGHVSKLSVIDVDGKYTTPFTKFDSNKGDGATAGGIYTLKVAKDGETVLGVAATGNTTFGAGTLIFNGSSQFSLTGVAGGTTTLATTVTPLIITRNGASYAKSSLSELYSKYNGYQVVGGEYNGADTAKVAVLVVDITETSKTNALNALKTAANTDLATLTGTYDAATGWDTKAEYTAGVAAIAAAKVTCANFVAAGGNTADLTGYVSIANSEAKKAAADTDIKAAKDALVGGSLGTSKDVSNANVLAAINLISAAKAKKYVYDAANTTATMAAQSSTSTHTRAVTFYFIDGTNKEITFTGDTDLGSGVAAANIILSADAGTWTE